MIFALRIVDVSLGTLRILLTLRGGKLLTWVFGFFQALVFIAAISVILSDLSNWLKIAGYAAGYASGNVVGMWLEYRLGFGYTQVNIVSPRRGTALSEYLRQEGYGITLIPARGKDGAVDLLSCSVQRKRANAVRKAVEAIDPEAFITSHELRPIGKGYRG